MSKHFCCCIPVRVAVFFASIITFLAAGFGAAVAWYTFHEVEIKAIVNNVNFGNINNKGKIFIIVAAVLLTIVCLISLFGFIGSVIRNRRMVKAYSAMIWLIFILHLAATCLYLYFVYSGKTFYDGCVTDDNNSNNICSFNLKTWQKILYTVVAVIGVFIQLYIASIIAKYKDQLYEERDYDHEYKLAKASGTSTYQPTYYPTTVQDNQGLLNPVAGPYPYTDSQHAFGSNRA